MERQPYHFPELFTGDWDLFKKVLQNRQTVFVFDMDGILANSAKIVLAKFTEKTGVAVKPSEIDGWDFLTNLARKSGLSEETIEHAEDDWYKAEVLGNAQRYLYIRPVIQKTVGYYGSANNFVLTSRNHTLRESTSSWFRQKLPEIHDENIIMRKEGDLRKSVPFKVDNLRIFAEAAPWIIFIDDNIDFIKGSLEAKIPNCLTVYVPLGKNMPDIRHERLILIKRYPNEIQAMYPLMDAIGRAISQDGNNDSVAHSY